MKYRRRHLAIEAMVYEGTRESALEIVDWMSGLLDGAFFGFTDSPKYMSFSIPGKQANFTVKTGDYVLQDVDGTFKAMDRVFFDVAHERIKIENKETE